MRSKYNTIWSWNDWRNPPQNVVSARGDGAIFENFVHFARFFRRDVIMAMIIGSVKSDVLTPPSCTGPCLVLKGQSRWHSLCCEPKTKNNSNRSIYWQLQTEQGHFGLISIVIMPWLLVIAQTHHPADSWVFFLRTRFISIHRDESEILTRWKFPCPSPLVS